VKSCIVDSAAIYIMVVKFRNTIWPPKPQLSLHRRAALSSNSNGTRSVNPNAVYIVRCLWALCIQCAHCRIPGTCAQIHGHMVGIRSANTRCYRRDWKVLYAISPHRFPTDPVQCIGVPSRMASSYSNFALTEPNPSPLETKYSRFTFWPVNTIPNWHRLHHLLNTVDIGAGTVKSGKMFHDTPISTYINLSATLTNIECIAIYCL
jgi:hypothetical protein